MMTEGTGAKRQTVVHKNNANKTIDVATRVPQNTRVN